MCREFIFVILLSLHVGYLHGFKKAHISITGGADPLPLNDDFPVVKEELPKELQDAIGPDDVLHEIIIREDDKQHVVHLKRDEFEQNFHALNEQHFLPKTFLAHLAPESPRSAPVDEEENRQGGLSNYSNLSRDELIQLLNRIQNLDSTLPSNRQSVLETQKETKSQAEIRNLARRIIVDESKLPGVLQPNGTRCLNKVIFQDDVESDFTMKCHHVLKNKCHLTYVTDYHSTPEKKCGTSFKKNCHIQFKPRPQNENVKKCHTPLVRKCGDGIVGPEICKVVYEDFCETKYKFYEFVQDVPECVKKPRIVCRNVTIDLIHLPHDHKGKVDFATKEVCEKWPVRKCEVVRKNVKKVHPDTECKRIGKKVCVPSNCIVVPDEETCHEQIRTVVHNIPEEDCNLDPFQQCQTESSLVPKLVPTKECVKVPKEICINIRTKPKRVKKPVLTKWCYDPKDLLKKIKHH